LGGREETVSMRSGWSDDKCSIIHFSRCDPASPSIVEPLREYEVGPMRIIPLVANHPDGDERGLNYIIQRKSKTILYALDTGWFLDETYEEVKRHTYDLVVIEGTFGFGAEAEAHMNLRKVRDARRLFEGDGLLKADAFFCTSHLCAHYTPVHDEIAPLMAEHGITVAYDGLTVELGEE